MHVHFTNQFDTHPATTFTTPLQHYTTTTMNAHHSNLHTPRRKRHLFDPSRIKIGVPVDRYAMAGKNGQEDAGGGKVEQRIGLGKRQWHEPWSLAVSIRLLPLLATSSHPLIVLSSQTESPSRAAATSTSAALARTTVVVTRVVSAFPCAYVDSLY